MILKTCRPSWISKLETRMRQPRKKRKVVLFSRSSQRRCRRLLRISANSVQWKRAMTSDIVTAFSIASFQASWRKEETSRISTVPAVRASTEKSLKMSKFGTRIQPRASYPWPTLAPIPMDLSSSFVSRIHRILTGNIPSSAVLSKVTTSYKKLRSLQQVNRTSQLRTSL